MRRARGRCHRYLHDQLVGAGNQAETVDAVELLRDVLAKGVPGSSWRNAPSRPLVRVGPEQVAHRALVRNLLHPVDGSDVVECV